MCAYFFRLRVADGDDFIANLWDVHLRVKKEGYVQVRYRLITRRSWDLHLTCRRQSLALGLFRSDYMVHGSDEGLQVKQVEFNTIASSFGGLSSQTSLLHKYRISYFIAPSAYSHCFR